MQYTQKHMTLKEVVHQIEYAEKFRPELKGLVLKVDNAHYFRYEGIKRAMQILFN